MDDNVMRMYTTTSTEAKHYVQYDQGASSLTLRKSKMKLMYSQI